MKKLNLTFIVGATLGVALLVVTAVILLKGYQDTQAANRQVLESRQLPAAVNPNNPILKSPDSSLGTQTATVSESKSYLNDLNQTKDDGGAQDLQQIDKDSQGL